MNHDKLLSVIVPTYNMEAYLDRCLSSLCIQDDTLMQRLEVLVIDDGSTDGSLAIAQRFATEHPLSYRAIHKTNGNYGSCINRGLAEATGRYVKVLDADDWYDGPGFIALLQLLSQTDADAVLTDYDQRDNAGRLLRHISLPIEPRRILCMEELTDEAMRAMMMHCVTLRTEMIRRIGYRQSEGISYTDQEWVFLPMAQAATVYYLPQPVYHYLMGRPGQTINLKVWDRNFWMELQGMRTMLADYNARQGRLTEGGHRYLRQRLSFRNYAIYEAYFTRFATTRNNALMRDYDQHLRQVLPELWQESAAYSIAGFAFVRRWRKAGYPAHIVGLWFWRRLGWGIKEVKRLLYHRS